VLRPAAGFIAPAQSVCNYASILFRNASNLIAFGDGGGGTYQRFIPLNPPTGTNSEQGPSSAPASGGGVNPILGGPDPANFLHYNPYPNTASPGQERECEAGNEDYLLGQTVIGNVPGNQGTITSEQLVQEVAKKKKKKPAKKKTKKAGN
jgi:hypothetical protein